MRTTRARTRQKGHGVGASEPSAVDPGSLTFCGAPGMLVDVLIRSAMAFSSPKKTAKNHVCGDDAALPGKQFRHRRGCSKSFRRFQTKHALIKLMNMDMTAFADLVEIAREEHKAVTGVFKTPKSGDRDERADQNCNSLRLSITSDFAFWFGFPCKAHVLLVPPERRPAFPQDVQKKPKWMYK